MDPEVRQRASLLFGALCHPTRIRMVEQLGEHAKSVNEIAGELGLQQSGASQHLAILTRAGVLAVERKGTSRLYKVRGPRIARIMVMIEEFCTIHGLQGSWPIETEVDESATGG